jgi:hypothetical protein
MPVSVTFEFDPQEHYRATRAVTRQLWTRWIPVGAVVLIVTFLAFDILGSWRDAERSQVFARSLPWVLLAMFWAVLLPAGQWWQARRLAKVDPSAVGLQARAVDEAGFHSRGNGVSIDVPWHAIRRVLETEEHFLFFYTRQCAYYITKARLTPQQTAQVREYAAAGARGRAELRGAAES